MSAEAPRLRRPRPPHLTPVRLTAGVVVALVALLALFAVPANMGWGLFAYMALVFATVATIRGIPREPGFWLGRRIVRRAVVLAVAAVCVALLDTGWGASSGGYLLLVLLLLNVVLGKATRRMATAPDVAVDEREEALRNRAHHLAYWVLAVAVAGTVVVSDVASSATRAWLGSALRGGAWLVFLELLFVLPAMTLAWLEPDRLAPEEVTPARDARARLALGMLAVTVLIPFLLSLGTLLLPLRTDASVSAAHVLGGQTPVRQPGAAPTTSAGATAVHCREFTAAVRVGLGGADIPVHAEACWDGRTAYESWGMNQNDCGMGSSLLTVLSTRQCTRTTASDGTLHFTYAVTARPWLLPVLTRDVTIQLVLDRNGTVVRFP